MFGCAAGRRVRLGCSIGAVCASALSAPGASAQNTGFPIDEPRPAPVAPAPVPTAPAPAPLYPPPVASAPAPVAPLPGPEAPIAYPVAPLGANASLPPLLPFRDGLPIPPGYHVEKRPASGLIMTGAVALGVGYLAGLGVGLDKGFDGSLGWLALPVIGPWPAVTGRKVNCAAVTVDEARQCLDSASKEATTIALVAVDGMVQATGLLLLLAGLASGQPELVRDDVSKVQVTAGRRSDGGFELGLHGQF